MAHPYFTVTPSPRYEKKNDTMVSRVKWHISGTRKKGGESFLADGIWQWKCKNLPAILGSPLFQPCVSTVVSSMSQHQWLPWCKGLHRCRKPTMNVDHFPTKKPFLCATSFCYFAPGYPSWVSLASKSYFEDRPRNRRQEITLVKKSLIPGFSHLITGLCPTSTTTSNWNDPPKPNFLG